MTEDPSKGKAPAPTSTPKPSATKPATPPPAARSPRLRPPRRAAKPNDAGWFLQFGAFSTKGAADAVIRDLKGKGYTASAVNSGALFKVRMGPVRGSRGSRQDGQPSDEGRVQAVSYALALLSGVLLAASFPKFGHPAFAWIALAPLIVGITLSVTSGRSGVRQLFLLAASSRVRLFRRHALLGGRHDGHLRRDLRLGGVSRRRVDVGVSRASTSACLACCLV